MLYHLRVTSLFAGLIGSSGVVLPICLLSPVTFAETHTSLRSFRGFYAVCFVPHLSNCLRAEFSILGLSASGLDSIILWLAQIRYQILIQNGARASFLGLSASGPHFIILWPGRVLYRILNQNGPPGSFPGLPTPDPDFVNVCGLVFTKCLYNRMGSPGVFPSLGVSWPDFVSLWIACINHQIMTQKPRPVSF
jgi:hypothetical protein